ncbi:hypothetical protein M407DRAFT_212855 [Tulasnella calospora MUT 4182]|uniref:Transmembrane protein n=1 Tax=Tulasnella calospora MUT 4182 TaxID=1051891 RepID=A0A0C3LSW2_9AGAM|nr:hypothetical protein M407DRAFT_212855 [Tulasnella calospora MUT 4182]
MPSLKVLILALLLICVDAAPLMNARSEPAAHEARAYTSKKKPKKTMTKKQGIIFGSVFAGFFLFVLLCSLYQNIQNRRRARRKKAANQKEFKKAVVFDRNGKPFFKPKARPKKTPSMPDLGSGTTAPSPGEKPMGGELDDSGVPSLTHATMVKKPEPAVTRREKDAWKEGTTVVAGSDAQDHEVTGVADLSLEKVKGGEGVEKAPFRLF